MEADLWNPTIWEPNHDDTPNTIYYQHHVDDNGDQWITLRDDITYLGGGQGNRFTFLPEEHRPTTDTVVPVETSDEETIMTAVTDGRLWFLPVGDELIGTIFYTAGLSWQITP